MHELKVKKSPALCIMLNLRSCQFLLFSFISIHSNVLQEVKKTRPAIFTGYFASEWSPKHVILTL